MSSGGARILGRTLSSRTLTAAATQNDLALEVTHLDLSRVALCLQDLMHTFPQQLPERIFSLKQLRSPRRLCVFQLPKSTAAAQLRLTCVVSGMWGSGKEKDGRECYP